MRFETGDRTLRASGPAFCPLKTHRIQIQLVGVLPVDPLIIADIGSVRADRREIAMGKKSNC